MIHATAARAFDGQDHVVAAGQFAATVAAADIVGVHLQALKLPLNSPGF
jgi:hypothetical protein